MMFESTEKWRQGMAHASIINFLSNEDTQELAPGFFIDSISSSFLSRFFHHLHLMFMVLPGVSSASRNKFMGNYIIDIHQIKNICYLKIRKKMSLCQEKTLLINQQPRPKGRGMLFS
jgi:hypothetical protein